MSDQIERAREVLAGLEAFSCPPGAQADALALSISIGRRVLDPANVEKLARVLDPEAWRIERVGKVLDNGIMVYESEASLERRRGQSLSLARAAIALMVGEA
jgi:hypothetical protein